MPRYDFVDPYARRSTWNDAADTFNDILDSERVRRGEIEGKRRFDEQTDIQRRYAREAELRGEADRYTSGLKLGPEGITGDFSKSWTSAQMRQGHGQDLERDAFGDTLARGRMTLQRGWQKDDEGESRGYFERMGFPSDLAGAAVTALPQTQYLMGPSDRSKDWWREQTDIEHKNRMGEIGAGRRAGGAGGAADDRAALTHLRQRYDDMSGRVAQIERQPIPQRRPGFDDLPGTPEFAKFTSDSTRIMRPREEELGRIGREQDVIGQEMNRLTRNLYGVDTNPPFKTGLSERELDRAWKEQDYLDFLMETKGIKPEAFAEDIRELSRRRGRGGR